MLIILSPTGGPSGRRPPQGPWPTLLLQDTYCPPNSCIPNRAKTTMKRKSRKRRLMMDFMELRRDTTRFLREFQYLSDRRMEEAGPPQSCFPLIQAYKLSPSLHMKHSSLQESKPTILEYQQQTRVCSAGLPGFPKPHQFSTEDIIAYQVARPKPKTSRSPTQPS